MSPPNANQASLEAVLVVPEGRRPNKKSIPLALFTADGEAVDLEALLTEVADLKERVTELEGEDPV